MVKVKSIRFGSMEGRRDTIALYEGKSYPDFVAFNRALWQLSRSIPADMLGCNKTDFVVEWENGETYSGTFELRREGSHNLGDHMRSFLLFASRRKRPFHLTEAQHFQATQYFTDEERAGMGRVLDEYQLD